jgi:hypothetical protein
MTTSNSWTTTLSASTEAHNGWNDTYYETIIVENLDASSPVSVTTDGSTATVGANGEDVVLPGQVGVFSNQQPRQDHVTTAPGSTSQQLTVPASGSLTYVSLISSGTPTVVVSPQ